MDGILNKFYTFKIILPVEKFRKEECNGYGHEKPGIWCMQNHQDKVGWVEEMGKVKDLKVSTVSHTRHWANGHDGYDDN